MHELSIAKSIVEQVEAIAAREHALRVESLTIALGALSGVDRGALEFAFPMAAEHSLLDGARLIIDEVPITALCADCGQMTSPNPSEGLLCLACHSTRIDITGGRELLIRSVELETPESVPHSSGANAASTERRD